MMLASVRSSSLIPHVQFTDRIGFHLSRRAGDEMMYTGIRRRY